MRFRILFFLVVFVLATFSISVFSQETDKRFPTHGSIIDSLFRDGVITMGSMQKPDIMLSREQSIKFLEQKLNAKNWNDRNNPLRKALGHLVFEASHPPFDSSALYLKRYQWDSIDIPWDKFYIWEPLKLKISTLNTADSASRTADTLNGNIADTLRVNRLTEFVNDSSARDTSILVVLDTLPEARSDRPGFPFRSYRYPFQSDSIAAAVKSLIRFLDDRDSSVINFIGAGGGAASLMYNSTGGQMSRFWLKNEYSDSVTIWIGNHSRDTIGLYLEKGVSFRRPVRQENYTEAKINIRQLDNSKLLNAKKIITKTQYWKYRSESSLIFSQAALSNWVKGGENSVSTSLDVTGYADYNNKLLKLSSSNFVRLKLGLLKSGSNPIRKNLDLLETNSKLNHKAFGKFDFSAIMLFKTQVAPGFNYALDPAPMVSKFLNPATLTLGFGLDYKPDKKTSVNFSPLSYKGTFVTDTVNIDQTKYGIAANKKSYNEPGMSFMISNEYKALKNLTVTNRLQLFTNYIHNPQNIDIDWEMIAVLNLNWFTDVRFNTHLIFDDDTKTVELDKDKKPVLRPDGTQKRTARAQFKEILGFSLVFRF